MTKSARPLCPDCRGQGYTQQTAPEMDLRYNRDLGAYVEAKTVKQGSGCPRCLGVGFLHDAR